MKENVLVVFNSWIYRLLIILMIDRFTMANLVLSVYCHNKRMICKNIFTGVHD